MILFTAEAQRTQRKTEKFSHRFSQIGTEVKGKAKKGEDPGVMNSDFTWQVQR